MAEETNEPPAPKAGGESSPSGRERRSRPRSLTPEQRRLLGIPRPLHNRTASEESAEPSSIDEQPPARPQPPMAEERTTKPTSEEIWPEETTHSDHVDKRESVPYAGVRKRDEKSSRAIEMQHAVLIIGAIIVLFGTFYVGKKFDYWRYMLMARKNQAKLTEPIPEKYRNASATELVEQGLAAEMRGDWRDAVERLLAAKHKNLQYRGILFRVGKLAYDNGAFDNADKLFERAIAFGENMAAANFFRGLIATRRRDLTAAQRFFEAAAAAEPFTADYYYYWGEALRLDYHPREALSRYEQAQRRSRGHQDVVACEFKMRMARLEAGEGAQIKSEIEKAGEKGPLSLDWLLTNAAVAIREGRIEEAARLLADAKALSLRVTDGPGIFVSCTGDNVFQDACRKHTELAEICQPNAASSVMSSTTR